MPQTMVQTKNHKKKVNKMQSHNLFSSHKKQKNNQCNPQKPDKKQKTRNSQQNCNIKAGTNEGHHNNQRRGNRGQGGQRYARRNEHNQG